MGLGRGRGSDQEKKEIRRRGLGVGWGVGGGVCILIRAESRSVLKRRSIKKGGGGLAGPGTGGKKRH